MIDAYRALVLKALNAASEIDKNDSIEVCTLVEFLSLGVGDDELEALEAELGVVHIVVGNAVCVRVV